jgi:hypothetical protein
VGNVGHVMRGQQHRDAAFPVEAQQEVTNTPLGYHIQPDGRKRLLRLYDTLHGYKKISPLYSRKLR